MTPFNPIHSLDDTTDPLHLDALFAHPQQPLCVDVGCGKGRHLAAVARGNPHKNFLGIDRQRSRIQRVSRKLVREKLEHVRLIRAEAAHVIHTQLPEASVASYTIFFPDPWPKRRHHRRRLFCVAFVDDLHRTMQTAGTLHVATDHLAYLDAIVGLFKRDARFVAAAPYLPSPEEQTDFERLFVGQGKPIGRASFEKR